MQPYGLKKEGVRHSLFPGVRRPSMKRGRQREAREVSFGDCDAKGCPLAEAAPPEEKWSAACPCEISKGGTHKEGCPLGASIELARSHGVADSHLIHDLSELDAFMRQR